MLLECSYAEADARQRSVDVHGQPYVLREYVGSAPKRGTYVDGNEVNGNALPQGFLVTQPPGSITRPHFHESHQFQVFVAGSGRFGNQPASPLTVQYASAHTPYGPIAAGDDGVQYFTLRKRWDPGAKYMPAMRERLVRGRQRQHLVANIALSEGPRLRSLEQSVLTAFIPAAADGLLGALQQVPPGARATTPAPADGDGQYHVVVSGALHHDGYTLPRWSCQFLSADEPPLEIEAGDAGLELLVLRFPPG